MNSYITGTITLKNGDVILISDETIVSNSLKVSMSTCSFDKFDIGSFNAATLKIRVFDDDALEHEFDGAKIEPFSSQKTEGEDGEETEESIPLGIYYVDGTKTKRKRNVVSLEAQDGTALFDKEFPSSLRQVPYDATEMLTAICSFAKTTLANTDLSSFPNYNVRFVASSKSIQTLRDAVMWIAQLLCCNAIIDREGKLEMRPARYFSPEGTSEITADYESDGSDRVDCQFSDVRTYTKYLSAYNLNVPKEYVSDITPSDAQAREGMLTLPSNPILEGMQFAWYDIINEAILEYIDGFGPRKIKASMFFNPSLKLGDTIRFRGGKIDVRRSIIGVVTGISWTYHGLMTVTCAAPQAVKAVIEDE